MRCLIRSCRLCRCSYGLFYGFSVVSCPRSRHTVTTGCSPPPNDLARRGREAGRFPGNVANKGITTMNVYFMLTFTRNTLEPNPVLVELFERLRAAGHEVELGVADEMVLETTQVGPRHDLYVLK